MLAQNWMPSLGDSMFMLVDRIPQNILVGDEGQNATYDVSVARAPFLRPDQILSPRQGHSYQQFKSADFVLKKYDGRELYFKNVNNNLYLLGEYGFYIQGQMIPVDVMYSDPVLMANYPHRYHQEKEQQYTATISFPVEYLNGSLRTQLPVAADSIRIEIESEDFKMIDGFGSLKYELSYQNVFREWVRSDKNYKFFLKVGDKDWQDFTPYVDMVKLFGAAISTHINFYDPDKAMPVAMVKINPYDRKPMFLEYEVREYLSEKTIVSNNLRPDIYAFPNPALSTVNIELNQLKPGLYTVVIYNILGQEKYRTSVDVIGNQAIQIDVSNFEKGPYLYGLVDSYGRRIITKRLTVLKP
ncbi:T9SS type A sorting domain-containing protein [Membranihabitans marinus]|uniref:T9SS type A sorting domain-containing protein n=1 Tax=Membranihabitans marinus TaxID=1227546 RepID=UPI001F2092CA|nr:T9SS type A sorting domain-containing protein [Membranihabitans marinus]